LIEGAIEATRVFAETLDVTVRLDDRAADVAICTDANRLTQVVANLLSNAVKFSPCDQEVVVTIEATDDRVCVAVRDHGPGIPDEFKARVFEKFVQVDASDARLRGGAGLGLSIVKRLMTRLGGDVSHDAAQCGGTIFRIDLRAGREGCGRRKRVLSRIDSVNCAAAICHLRWGPRLLYSRHCKVRSSGVACSGVNSLPSLAAWRQLFGRCR